MKHLTLPDYIAEAEQCGEAARATLLRDALRAGLFDFPPLHLAYSPTAARYFGASVFVDQDGNQIEATASSEDKDWLLTAYANHYPDAEYRGLGQRCIGTRPPKANA